LLTAIDSDSPEEEEEEEEVKLLALGINDMIPWVDFHDSCCRQMISFWNKKVTWIPI
jgi:hypothetical protein